MQRYEIHNPTDRNRVIFIPTPPGHRKVLIESKATAYDVELPPTLAYQLSRPPSDLVLKKTEPDPPKPTINLVGGEFQPLPDLGSNKPPLVITGMYGIGDNLHQRAIIRKLMPRYDIYLETCHVANYHDFVKQGLKLIFKPTRLRAQAKTIQREKGQYYTGKIPAGALRKKIWYHKHEIDRFGSILHVMANVCDVGTIDLDFRLPLLPEWTENARKLIAQWDTKGKPLLIYRPIVVRREWDGRSRNPLPEVYAALFEDIRDKFFVVSIADLEPNQEWIDGKVQDVDVKLHKGELDFPTMAALWAEAALVYSPAGFGPVLAQAVGTPSITIYGGRESFRTTQAAGAHLAPSLGIDPDHPCDCHTNTHNCNKHTTIPPAKAKIQAFLEQFVYRKAKTLIFATTYVDSPDRMKLTDHWLTLTQKLNPDCDILIVDSQSPMLNIEAKQGKFITYAPGMRAQRMLFNFPDNIGHLSRKDVTLGRDGWGRAFCFGLEAAINGGYEYAVHIEGDSLFRLPVTPIVREMEKNNTKVASIPVMGTTRTMTRWVETGLMFFSTKYLKESDFIRKYDWEHRTVSPTPEVVIHDLISLDLKMMPWKGWRGDKNQITHQNVISLDLDWVTHCHRDAWVYDRYVEDVLKKLEPPPPIVVEEVSLPLPEKPPEGIVKINFGCGDNRLRGWLNHDAEVDISKKLPYDDNSANFVLCEHCVEHINYYSAIEFFKECRRILKSGGVVRIVTPSIEKIWKCNNPGYFQFTTKFHKQGANVRGAMHSILYAHGHQTAWTDTLLEATLFYAGFENVTKCEPYKSSHPELVGVEGHHRIIGREWNDIESIVYEGTVDKSEAIIVPRSLENAVAIILGGSNKVFEDFARAKDLCREAGMQYETFVTNDLIALFPETIDHVVTLHPVKLSAWLQQRASNGFPMPTRMWGHMRHQTITDVAQDWAGSSGLFAAKIAAVDLCRKKVLLCGVPMSPEYNHITRKIRWNAAQAFRDRWPTHMADIKPFVRSLSGGWTEEKLGVPTVDWLREDLDVPRVLNGGGDVPPPVISVDRRTEPGQLPQLERV